ncbi:MAG TPA: hypothetical protein VG077_00860 [Verrucomicrobiae bacterium]|nr:hypothetical protein [Verrucomicrobiae bacterium]
MKKTASTCSRLAPNKRSALATGTALAMALWLSAGPAGAQLLYTGGTGEIEFSGQPVGTYGGIPPLWAFDGFTGNNDILASPGGTFNGVNYVNPNLFGTGVVPLGPGIFATAAPGVDNGIAFGGGSISINPAAVGFSIGETSPGNVSVGIGAESSTFTVGAGGVPGATIGTYLSLNGILSPSSAIAASLVTYVSDITTGNSVVLAEVLGATGTGYGSKFVALSGQLGSPVAGANAWVLFGNAGTTYSGFASAFVPNFLNPGDNVQITSVLTEAADPYSLDATIYSDGVPVDLNGATLPDVLLYDTTPSVPEPGALAFLAVGAAAGWLLDRRRVVA